MFIKKFTLIGFLVISSLFGQEEVDSEEFYKEVAQGISVVYFNAEWNESNCVLDTLDVINNYEESKLLKVVNGEMPINEITNEISGLIEAIKG